MVDPEHPPRRRRGLPRTEAEQQSQQPSEQQDQEQQSRDQQSNAAPDLNSAATTADASTETPAERPARRAGMNDQPRRQGMSTRPTRRTGMGHQSPQQGHDEQQGHQGQQSDPSSRRAGVGERPRRMGMAQQPEKSQADQPPQQQASRRAGLAPAADESAPVAQRPQSAPAEAETPPSKTQSSKAPPSKSQPPQKTFLNRTAKQWTIQGGLGVVAVIIVAAAAVLGARWLLGTDAVSDFVERYPGQYSQPEAPGGYPWWLNWAHFFNAFLMVLVIKTGIQIRTEARAAAYWTPRWNKKRKISLTIWLHNSLDLLWVLNGALFVLLLIITGYWQRVVPTSWEVFPNALSAGLQYASLDWPTIGEWAHYNSLQELAYFTTIFIAAPVAILTGLRMSGLWPTQNQGLNKLFPVELARAVHFPVMIYFTVFILVHLILVFATDALANLNQIYTGDDAQNWTGFWLFALSLAVIVAGAFLARALFAAPIASLFGRVGR